MRVIEANDVCRSFKVAKHEQNSLKYLVKREYETIEAVKNVSFQINKGDIVGFIGPNGAGKSTTIKMMTGILVPTEGSIRVLGNDPFKSRKENAKHIGVLFGQRSQLWWDLPVIDTYRLLKHIYGIPQNTYEENLALYGEILGINSFLAQPVRQLSLGQRMRADLCASLLHNPEILFLDEPTIGLDVVVKKQIREMICDINKRKGVTVILTTHDMKDIEATCDRIIMIDKGRIIVDKPTKEVISGFKGESSMSVVLDGPPESINLNGVERVAFEDGRFTIFYNQAQIKSADIVTELAQKYRIVDLSLHEPEIDEIIQNLYQS